MNAELRQQKLVYAQPWFNGMTQKEIADDIGCHQSTVSRRKKSGKNLIMAIKPLAIGLQILNARKKRRIKAIRPQTFNVQWI